jgi:hypothetical protein
MSRHIPTLSASQIIRPCDINAANTIFLGAFGNHEVECVARAIVWHCQLTGEWTPFSPDEIKEKFARMFNDIADRKESYWNLFIHPERNNPLLSALLPKEQQPSAGG